MSYFVNRLDQNAVNDIEVRHKNVHSLIHAATCIYIAGELTFIHPAYRRGTNCTVLGHNRPRDKQMEFLRWVDNVPLYMLAVWYAKISF